MAKYSLYIIVMLTIVLVGGCGEDGNNNPAPTSSAPPVTTPDGISLLGLSDGRVLSYLVTDTVTLLYPTYIVDVATSSLNVTISGANQDWQIKRDSIPVVNIKVTANTVLFNGYWQNVNGQDSLFYFSVPSITMVKDFEETSSWEGYCPSFADSARVFYSTYFGFYFTKKFAGTERLYLPAGEFDAYRFDIQLFDSEQKKDVVINLSEHYAPGVGLVQLTLRGGALIRTLSLIDVSGPVN